MARTRKVRKGRVVRHRDEVDRGKVHRAGIFRPELVVALVEHGVDRVGEKERPGELELVLVDEHAHVGRQGIRTLAEAPQFDRDPLDPRRAASTWPWKEPTTVVRWTIRSDGCIRFEATVDLGGTQDIWDRERVRRHVHASWPAAAES